jgi:hypothetical protein
MEDDNSTLPRNPFILDKAALTVTSTVEDEEGYSFI